MTILAPAPGFGDWDDSELTELVDWDSLEPTAAELAAIEAESSALAAELDDLDAAFARYAVTLDVTDLEYRPAPAAAPVTVLHPVPADTDTAEGEGVDADGAILATANAFHAEGGRYYWAAVA